MTNMKVEKSCFETKLSQDVLELVDTMANNTGYPRHDSGDADWKGRIKDTHIVHVRASFHSCVRFREILLKKYNF